MSHYVIRGGQPLNGTLRISGEKNSVLPLLACATLTSEPCTLSDVPEISDVERFVEALREMGATIDWDKPQKTLTLDCAALDPTRVESCTYLGTTRANIILAGALLGRFGEVRMVMPGGDAIGHRPLAMHLEGLAHFGVQILQADTHLHLRYDPTQPPQPHPMILSEASVTGTETLLAFLATVPHPSTLCFAAADPQVQATCQMLQSMGVKVSGVGTHHLQLTGAKTLRGTQQQVSPDVTVTGTYAIAAALTGGTVTLTNVHHPHLYSFYGYLRRLGVNFTIDHQHRALHIAPPHDLQAIRTIKPNIFPGLCPDLMAPLSVLLTQCHGTTQLFEWMYEDRLGHLWELKKMGAQVKILNLHQAEITGPTPLRGANVQSWDLRAGAAMVLAGLIAEGQTTVSDIYWIDRGYEHLATNLQSLGADITRVE